MNLPLLAGWLALCAAPGHPAPGPAGAGSDAATPHVRVTARIVVVDRDAFARAGLAYVVIGNERVRVSARVPRPEAGLRAAIGTHGVGAFLEVARSSRWIRSESTQQVLALSGSEAFVASNELSVGRRMVRTRGPSLSVVPSVRPDGAVHLRVTAGVEDVVTDAWGYGVDGSPAAVTTEIIALDGEEVVLASSTSVQSTREAGLLRWGGREESRDVLVVVSATVLPR